MDNKYNKERGRRQERE